jgi:uncharacterized protein (TIGR03435 family)
MTAGCVVQDYLPGAFEDGGAGTRNTGEIVRHFFAPGGVYLLMRFTRLAALATLWVAAAFSQTPAAPEFDAASVKPATPQADGRMMVGMRGGPGTGDVGHATFTNMSLMNLITQAYNVKEYQVTGPPWLGSERYDLETTEPADTTKAQFGLMLQKLLADRFHLILHHESKEFQGYELVVAKGGSKLKESTPEDAAFDPATAGPPTAPGQSGPPKLDANGFISMDRPGMVMMMRMSGKGGAAAHVTARAQALDRLTEMLCNELRRPVVDKTGLKGKYDFTLEYAAENLPGGGLPPPPPPAGAQAGTADARDDLEPTITTAIQQQLGLRLDAKKIQLDVLVIEKADKVPTEN